MLNETGRSPENNFNDIGKVILLNGTSSAGKSSIAKVIQEVSDIPYLHLSLDMFWDMTPAKISANSKNFPQMRKALAKSVYALAITGHNVVVDIVVAGASSFESISHELRDLKLLTVKVYCPLPVLAEREKARGNRRIGLAESQYTDFHLGIVYDLSVDTSISSSEELGREILLAVDRK